MLRDKIKSYDYFLSSIDKREKLIQKNIDRIVNGKVSRDREPNVKQFRIGLYKNNLIARYSRGDDMNSQKVISDYVNAIELMDEIWESKAWNMTYTNSKKEIISLNQYTFSGFLDFTKMLSLGILLDIPKEYVLKLIKFIDGDEVKDSLFEFFINHLVSDRKSILEESYSKFFHVNERYKILKEVILVDDKSKAQEMLKLFLDKKWYSSFKGTPLHNQHNNPHNTYVGYWCFEAAAITKIMGLDDSSYIDNQYYPKDLV
ncbi:PoNe immunity protein domain-containing protein [Kordia sp.]|uniref:PoNe immunity protein domain-containing protein n=1 Tax=Kordia sp. TaxID=1965332 RepID=UPI003B5B0567